MKYVYLHGLGQNADSWSRVTDAAGTADESVCLDLAALIKGKTATYSELYAAFSAMCEAEGGDLALCGLSLGGVLALHYAIDYPQRVKALVLIVAPYRIPARLLKLQNALFRLMPRSMFGQTGFGKEDFISLCGSMAELDFSRSLSRIACPALVVCGERDRANKKASVRLADNLRHSQFIEIPEAGHEVNGQSPDRLAAALRAFYKSI